MSDLQPPPPPPPGGPGGPPRPDWNPTALSGSGQASYVGRTSAPDPASEDQRNAPAINTFAPKRSLVPALVAVVTVLIAAAVVYAAIIPATPTPTPSAASSPTPSASTTPRAGTPFTVAYTDITGVWQITKHRWTARGLDIYVEVSVDTGDLYCLFNALSASGEQARDATPSQLSPNFVTGLIGPGEQRSGWVHLPLTERGTALVFLHTPSQGQVSGIEVSE
ncbi:MAG: hypothetical protein K4304_04780 [Propionicimonas sp.]